MGTGGVAGEEWRDVAGYEGLYKVSSLGRVYSVPRLSSNGNTVGGYFLKPRKFRNGYNFTALCRDGKSRQFTIHRLVASAFIENPRNCLEVNHIDGNKDNNAASNLEWCTRSENNLHAVKTGLRSLDKMHERARESRMRPVVFSFEGREVARFPSMKDASDITGISVTNISACARGTLQTCDGYEVSYADA